MLLPWRKNMHGFLSNQRNNHMCKWNYIKDKTLATYCIFRWFSPTAHFTSMHQQPSMKNGHVQVHKSCIQHGRHVSCAKVVSMVYILTKLPNKTKGCADYVLVDTLAFYNSLAEVWWLNQTTCMKINRVTKLMLHANGPAYRPLCSVNK